MTEHDPNTLVRLEEPIAHVATITIDRPKALNALNPTVLEQLRAAVAGLGGRDDIDVVVLTGAGRAFVAGADIAAMQTMSVAEARDFAELGHATMSAVAGLEQVTIAAINGFALGGGLELALCCDLLYASEKARLGLPEVSLGLIPGFGGTQRLGRRVGYQLAREMTFTGRHVKAQEAHARGIVLDVFEADDFMERVLEIAATIAKQGPHAVRCAKRVMADGREMTLADGLARELDAFAGLFATGEPAEGIRAFLEKRDAAFRNG
ncbi:MAG: enoyl-CoA hydratase-related protein [Myxococcota bacterium]